MLSGGYFNVLWKTANEQIFSVEEPPLLPSYLVASARPLTCLSFVDNPFSSDEARDWTAVVVSGDCSAHGRDQVRS